MDQDPDPEVAERPKRRVVSAAYKAAILDELDRSTEPGARGALLRRGGIAMFAPADVHHGPAAALHAVRSTVLADAYAAHPERFVKGPPRAALVPREVWINPPRKEMPGV